MTSTNGKSPWVVVDNTSEPLGQVRVDHQYTGEFIVLGHAPRERPVGTELDALDDMRALAQRVAVALNWHDALVEALRLAIEPLDRAAMVANERGCKHTGKYYADRAGLLRAAIASVEGGASC